MAQAGRTDGGGGGGGQGFTSTSSGAMHRIVTLNVWKCDGAYKARPHAMTSGLATLNADVVCLQQCFATLPQAAPRRGNDAMPEADTAITLVHRPDMDLLAPPARCKQHIHLAISLLPTTGLASRRDPQARASSANRRLRR